TQGTSSYSSGSKTPPTRSPSPGDAMDLEQRLNQMADRYRSLGFKVVVRPGPEDLPPFARDFKVEILATREGDSVLASARETLSEMEADPDVARYAVITDGQPGWRFEILALGPDKQAPERQEPKEPTEEEICRQLDAVERMVRAGF